MEGSELNIFKCKFQKYHKERKNISYKKTTPVPRGSKSFFGEVFRHIALTLLGRILVYNLWKERQIAILYFIHHCPFSFAYVSVFFCVRINMDLPAIHEALYGTSTGLVTGSHRIRIAVCRIDFEHWPRGH